MPGKFNHGLLKKRENFIQALFRTEHQFAPGKINSLPAEPGRCRVNLAAMLGENPLRRA
jgi:hypothetical protein